MKPGALIVGAVATVILLAAAGVLYLMANDGGERHYRGSIGTVQQIQRLSSDWSIELSRVKSDPLADFDSLAAFIPRMARLKTDLSETARSIPDLPDRLANSINAYISAIDAKEERVERFKTGYAVVRNSTRYLPLAAANAVQQAEQLGDQQLARDISGLTQEMDLYLVTPSDEAQTRLRREMESLRETSVRYPPALANTLSNLFSHAEVLLNRQGPIEELFEEATSDKISRLTDELAGSLRFELGRKEVQLAYYDRGMLVVIALLALFWISACIAPETAGRDRRGRRRNRRRRPAAGAIGIVAAEHWPPPVPNSRRGPTGRGLAADERRSRSGEGDNQRVRGQVRRRQPGRLGGSDRCPHGLSGTDPAAPAERARQRRHRRRGARRHRSR